jgi:hypothetical protein
LNKEGKGKYGWEELPYWLKGYGDMATCWERPENAGTYQVLDRGSVE